LIIDVPTAGGDSVYPPNHRAPAGLYRAGAKNVVMVHTVDRKVADSDSFPALLARAGGVWFEGGRQWHLVDSYAGTKTEKAFMDVLARGGVIGGSSAGASILASYLLRGARSGNAIIMAPGYEVGFGYLRGTAIDQHVVARERLRDLADSLMPRHPELLGMSEDEGTAWVVWGDTAEIVGRNKAFAYGGKATDPGKPFLTLFPGDKYDLGARQVIRRSIDDSRLTEAMVDREFAECADPCQATVLIARDGKVLLAKGYGIPPHPKYLPATTVPNFVLGGVSVAFASAARQHAPAGTALTPAIITRRLFTPIGARKTQVDTTGGGLRFRSNVDELYRLELGLETPEIFSGAAVSDENGTVSVAVAADTIAPAIDPAQGWAVDRFIGVERLMLYGTPDGKRNAFVRIPSQRIAVIILSDAEALDAGKIADQILQRLIRK
jgi:cyanophycinase